MVDNKKKNERKGPEHSYEHFETVNNKNYFDKSPGIGAQVWCPCSRQEACAWSWQSEASLA